MTPIAIFVKTPGLSPVKSRLAEAVGHRLAEQCHLRCAQTVAAVAKAADIGPVYWAVAEDDARARALWEGLPTLVQPQSSLGERMRDIHDFLIQRHGRGMLVGADLPQLDQTALKLAGHWLEGQIDRGIVGPALDGGFWLVGANRSLPGAIWQKPEYGTDTVLNQFIDAIGDTLDWHHLAGCTDLDRIDDLVKVLDEMKNLPCPHDEQRRLLDWLHVNLIEPNQRPSSE